MMIFLPMVVPPIAAIVLLIFFRHKVLWWEFLIPTVASLLLAFIFKAMTETIQTLDTEYHTNGMVKAEYYEDWTEEYVETYTDSKGNIQTRTVTLYHPPQYYIYDKGGNQISIDKSHFFELCNWFGNKREKDLYHFNQVSWGDGDMWFTVYNGEPHKYIPVSTTHYYENRVQASDSVFNYPEVNEKNKEVFALYDYPSVTNFYYCPSILGDAPDYQEANKLLTEYNSKMGRNKEIRMWILIFKNQSSEAAHQQEALWKNGNKNELVVCIGVNKQYDVKWSYVFSWTDRQNVKINIRDFVVSQKKLDLVPIVEFMAKNVLKNWKRKEFSDFNYLAVEPPISAIVVSFLFTIALNVGVSYWIIQNDIQELPKWKRKGGLEKRYSNYLR